MKKLFVASVLALAVTVAGQQRASAWSEFKIGAGVGLSWCTSGASWSFCINRQAYPYPGCQDCVGFAAAAPAYFGGYASVPAAGSYYGGLAAQGPAAMPTQQYSYNPYFNTGYQPVGYASAGYASQVPSYWYGR